MKKTIFLILLVTLTFATFASEEVKNSESGDASSKKTALIAATTVNAGTSYRLFSKANSIRENARYTIFQSAPYPSNLQNYDVKSLAFHSIPGEEIRVVFRFTTLSDTTSKNRYIQTLSKRIEENKASAKRLRAEILSITNADDRQWIINSAEIYEHEVKEGEAKLAIAKEIPAEDFQTPDKALQKVFTNADEATNFVKNLGTARLKVDSFSTIPAEALEQASKIKTFGYIAGTLSILGLGTTIYQLTDGSTSHLFDGEEGKSASDDFKQNLDGSTDPTSVNEG